MVKIKYGKNKKCKFEIGFNALGMPVFLCRTHGTKDYDAIIKDFRLQRICMKELEKKLKKVLKL